MGSQDHFVSATTHMTTAMSSWKVLASARLVRLASAPTCQTSAPGMLLLTRSGSTRASFAKNEHHQNKNDRNNKNGQKAAIALASATALALKVYYEGNTPQAQNNDDVSNGFLQCNHTRLHIGPWSWCWSPC